MRVLARLHGNLVFPRRVSVLASNLAPLLAPNARFLDLGCGDGLVASAIRSARPDLTVRGCDVLVRDGAHIPVDRIEGERLPYPDKDFDAVLIVDVLHHSADPAALLREAARISRGSIVIKDHLSDRWLAGLRLRLMDFVGNAHHGVALPYNYWPRDRWSAAFRELGLVEDRRIEELGLYPKPFRWLAEDGLHFLVRLRRA